MHFKYAFCVTILTDALLRLLSFDSVPLGTYSLCSEMISASYHNRADVLTLDRGVTDALNLELLRELADSLRDLKQDSNVNGIVLACSNRKFFPIGFDLPQLIELGVPVPYLADCVLRHSLAIQTECSYRSKTLGGT